MTRDRYIDIVSRHTSENGRVLSILQEIQRNYRHLPGEALRAVAEELGLPLSQLYGVATFYGSFSLRPRGEHAVSVCHGTVCHVKGAPRITEELENKLDVKTGDTTADGLFTLESVRCLGCCSLAPVVGIDGSVHARVRPEGLDHLLKSVVPGGESGD